MSRPLTVHWLGAGLSSGPGIRKIANSGRSLTLWNRTPSKADEVFSGHPLRPTVKVKKFELGDFQKALEPGSVVVSMLPANMHTDIAELCLGKRAHLVTTSYLSPGMLAYDSAARSAGLSFLNESGLDPGIDHVFAHKLMADFRASAAFNPKADFSFVSYCGGFPQTPNDFKYKFSWSPVGVLRALKNPATYITKGEERTAQFPWEDTKVYTLNGENFEVYPNRNSIPYISDYGFDSNWHVKEFVRGTIRLKGWSQAWSKVFSEIRDADATTLEKLSETLWKENAYDEAEPDRVVLTVSLTAELDGKTLWSKSLSMDECGTGQESAMARLVSIPATFAVDSLESGPSAGSATASRPAVPLGVSGAPHSPSECERWITELKHLCFGIIES